MGPSITASGHLDGEIPSIHSRVKAFPNLPLTEVLFLSKIIDRIVFLDKNGDQFGFQKERTFASLVDHKEDIKKDFAKMEHFEKLYSKMSLFRKAEMIDKLRWYFDCECSRCTDPADDVLTSIKCSTSECDEPLITSETATPTNITCPKCGNVTEDTTVISAQQLMLELPATFDPHCPAETLEELLIKAEKILHSNNVYISRLRTALFHVTGQLSANLGTMHKQIYNNYKMTFPKADRHVGYQLLHIVKALIEKGERSEAVSYAFDAMSIFEVCFGLDHPYYLQTLALWTYLEKKMLKSDQELIQLTNFSDNRPVDITGLLQKANILS
uniref:Tetratricopeptide repeat protein n=1 Tax=Heterorhabditis bacteriophora TaxID=37862 RepID=A0A1I7XI77_HETBA